MSDATLTEISDAAVEVGVQAAWSQWASLGANVSGEPGRPSRSIIDPEALLLLSLWLVPAEQRLRDFVYWWASAGSELTSVQRTKTLLRSFPPPVQDRVGTFARWAAEAGDKRWKRYAAKEKSGGKGRQGKGKEEPRIKGTPALALRLRAGFGVGAKADVLAFLLGLEERAVSTQQAAKAACYSRATSKGVLADMARAGFVQEEKEHGTTRYYARQGPWAELLRFGGERSPEHESVPRWRHWADVYALLAQAQYWAEETQGESAYLQSSRARDVFENHEAAFSRNRVQAPRPEEYRGASYLGAFRETIEVLSEWVGEHL